MAIGRSHRSDSVTRRSRGGCPRADGDCVPSTSDPVPQILGPTDDLLGYWPLDSIEDGTAENIVGTNDGTPKGDVLDRPGQVNRAAEFDVDIALRFPEGTDDRERFRQRNRIDAELQAYATGFVDVSDIDALPTSVAYAALRDGIRLLGDETAVDAYGSTSKRNTSRRRTSGNDDDAD